MGNRKKVSVRTEENLSLPLFLLIFLPLGEGPLTKENDKEGREREGARTL